MSNELNMILKAKVVKIKVQLDYKGSGLPAQVDGITAKLANKPVKLKVKLDITMKDFNTQLGSLKTKLNSGKAIAPIKIGVQLDVKGSAKAIQQQLKDVTATVDAFNKKYAKQIQEMQQKTQQAGKSTGGITAPSINTASYMNSLKDAEKYMKSTFGKGLFTSQEMKNASGELLGFTTTLTKANGVVQKIRYDWDANKSKFTPISRQTLTDTEKSINKAKQALRNMYTDIEKLDNGKGKSGLFKSFEDLEKRASHGTLNSGMVDNLRNMVKQEEVLQKQVKNSNAELLTQKKLIHDIAKARDKDWKANQDVSRRGQYNDLMKDVKSNPNLKDQAFELKKINDLSSKQANSERDILKNTKERLKTLQQLRTISNQTPSNDKTSQALISEIKYMAQRAKSAKEWIAITDKMNKLQTSNANAGMASKSADLQFKIEQKMRRLVDLGKMTSQEFNKAMQQLPITASRNFADLGRQYEVLNRKVQVENEAMKRSANATKSIFTGGSKEAKNLKSLVNTGDIASLERYFGQMYKGQVSTINLRDATDRLGRSVTQMDIKMKGTGKTVQTYTLQMQQANGALAQTQQGLDFNANRNLGIMEQLKTAMARVPVWMVAMTAFYGTINVVKNMTQEILKLDSAMTELRRVADSQINIGYVFEGAIGLAKELGNNVHDVMQSVNDLARTFGHFNERQLLAIAKTGTLMSNVSDLNAQEATESLIGTMNAFNITAEDSIRIVDSLNEVDNNYAISTKQLATGLQKSASTSKTFGVTLEENVGHITAIGAVTMESGNIIGNSLKTIYSRITTMAGAGEALEGVGVAINDMATGEVRDVSDILGDLALRWDDLSDSERQNIAVSVAGRYQLSRFLALMNNFKMASEATATALTSEGSAMRENAQYMKSYEARINQMKNGFTALSSAVGDAFLSGAMSTGINALTKLGEIAVSLVDKFGALPAVFGLITLALLKFKVFNTLGASMVAGMTSIQTAFTTTQARANAFSTTMARTSAGTVAGFRAMQAGAISMASSVRTAFAGMAVGIKSAMASTGILLAFVAIGFAIEKLVSKIEDARIKEQELVKLNDKMITSYRASGDGMQDMITRYDNLSRAGRLNAEQQEELNLLTKQFAEQLPTTVDYIDANGEAHLREVGVMKDKIEAVKELSREQAKLQEMQFVENMQEESKAYMDIIKNIQKLNKEKSKLEEKDGTEQRGSGTVWSADRGGKTGKALTIDNSKELQMNAVEMMMLEADKTNAIQQTIKAVQAQSLAYFEANGKMKGLGDSQSKVIEDMISYNEEMLRTAGSEAEAVQAYESLYAIGKEVGTVFSDAFTIMTDGLENQPDKIEQIRTQLGMVSDAIPRDFLKIDDENISASTLRVTNGLKEIVNVSTQIEAGSTDLDGLRERLKAQGMTADQAGNYISELARQHDNLGLRQIALQQGLDGTTGALEDQTEAVIDSIDAVGTLFGYENKDLSAIKTHIESLELLKHTYKDGAEGSAEYQASLGEVADFLNVTRTEVRDNIHEYNILVGALQNVKIATDEQGGSYLDLSEETSGLTAKQRELIQSWIDAGGTTDIITGANKEVAGSMEEVKGAVEDLNKTNIEPFKIENPLKDGNITNGIYDIINAQKLAKTSLLDSGKIVSNTINDVNNAGKHLGVITSDLDGVTASAEKTTEKTTEVGKTLSDSFTSASSIVGARSDSMIGKHNSQRTAIDEVARSARNARQDLINVNSMAQTTVTSLGKVASANSVASSSRLSFGNAQISSIDGINTNVSNSISAYSDSVSSVFSATAGEGGESSFGGGEGTSGVIKAPTPQPFIALHNTSGAIKYSGKGASSSSSSPSTSSAIKKKETQTAIKKATKSATKSAKEKKDKAEELAELYVIDLLERRKTSYQGTLNQIEAKMASLSKGTTKYRDAIRSTLVYENQLFAVATKSLASTIARNSAIEKQLKKLGNTSKHNKAQREEYNKLQQEYDSNLSKIAGLKSEVENTITTIRDKSTEIFSDFIDEIVGKYDKAINKIKEKVSNLDFRMEVLELTQPDNVKDQLNLQAEKVSEHTKERAEWLKSIVDLEKQYNSEMKANPNSDKTKYVKEKLDEARESVKGLTLDILKSEKAIKDTRADVADEGIKQLKDYYGKMKDMATEAIDLEIKALQKAHDKKIELYDDEIEKINDIYDAKLKTIDDEISQETYDEELANKNTERDATQTKIDALSFSANSGSLEDKKKVAELQKQLQEQNKDIDKFMKDRKRNLLKEELEEQRDMQLEALENKKETEEKALETVIERLEAEKEAVEKHYDAILENEKYWADMRDKFIKGNFAVLTTELGKMSKTLKEMDEGVFTSLTKSFTTFSDQVKKDIAEINSLSIKNSLFNLTPTSNAVSQVGQTKHEMTDGNGNGTASGLGELSITKPINLWKREGDGTLTEVKVLKAGEKYKVYGRDDKFGGQYNVGGGLWVTDIPDHVKYKRFDTGGYTGNSEGMAFLDKKEIVLKETDTKNLLDTIKMLDKVKNTASQIPVGGIPLKTLEKAFGINGGNSNTNEYKVEVNIGNMTGDKDSAKEVASVFMKELRKMGQ